MKMGTTRVTAILAIAAAILVTTAAVAAAAEEAPAPAPSTLEEAPAPAPSTLADKCTNSLFNLSDCLSYVVDGSNATKPDKSCCPEVAGLVESNPTCLCLLFGNTTQTLGIEINITKALKLPSVCAVQTPDPSLCSVVGIPVASSPGSPTANDVPKSPGPQPPSADTSPSSTDTSPNGGSRIAGSALAFIFGLAIAFHPTFF